MAAKKKEKMAPAPWMYDVVRRPIVTEKSARGSEHGQMTFEVAIDATKPKIKQAVETLFEVEVKAVNTLIQKGKTKRFKGIMGQRKDMNKAIVTLKDGQAIDTGTGV
jgi:large subunit ribosomal protein L23